MNNSEKEDINKPEPGLIESIVPGGHGDNIAYRRRKRSPRGGGLKWLLAGFSLLIFYVFFMLLIMPVLIPGVLSARLEKNIGWQVDISSFKITPFSWQWEIKGLSGFLPDCEEGESFFKVSSVSGSLDLPALSKGQVKALGVFIDSPEILLRRNEQGELRLPPGLAGYLVSLVGFGEHGYSPGLFSLRVENGSFVVDDRLTGTLSKIENISFRPQRETKTISVQMLVNGEPLAISFGSGSLEDSFRFDFDDFEPGSALAFLLPELSAVVSGRVGGNIELDLAGIDDGQVVMSGDLQLDDIKFARLSDEVERLVIPAGNISFTVEPSKERLIIKRGVIEQPVVRLKEESLSDWLPGLKQVVAGVTIKKLLVEQGKLELMMNTGQPFALDGLDVVIWQDRDSLPVKMKISASGFEPFKGSLKMDTIISAKDIAGRIQLSDLDTALLPASFKKKNGITKLKGIADLDGEIAIPLSGAVFKPVFSNLKISLKDMKISTDANFLLDGGKLSCLSERFIVGAERGGLFCERLDIIGTELTMPVPFTGGDGDGGKSPALFRDLGIKESTLNLVLPGNGELLTLDKVALSSRDVGKRQRQVKVEAKVGKYGKLALSGTLIGGRGQLEYEVNGVALADIAVVRHLFADSLYGGVVKGYGQLSVPEFKAVGELVLGDFAVEHEKLKLNFSRLIFPRLIMQLEPPYLGGKDMSLSGFVLNLRDRGITLANIAAVQQEWAGYLAGFDLGKIYFQDGEMVGAGSFFVPGYQPDLSALHGFVDGLSGNSWQAEVGGAIGSGQFQVAGLLSEGRLFAEIELDRSVLSAPELDFLAEYGLDGSRLSFHLHQLSRENEEGGEGGEGTGHAEKAEDLSWIVSCRLDKLFPLPTSDFSFMLAMLTDQSGALDLQFIDNSASFLLESLLAELQRLRDKVMVDTAFAVEFPLLGLPPAHLFTAGQAEKDNLFLLDDYAELLAMRPRLTLVLTGGFDSESDRDALQVILQEEVDARREAENLKLEIENLKREIGGGGWAVDEDVQTVPEIVVEVPAGLLHNLALKRRDLVWDYLVNERGVALEQLILSDNIRRDIAGVAFQVTGGR